MEKWGKTLDSESIKEELLKDTKQQMSKLENEAKTKVVEGLVPVLLTAAQAGEAGRALSRQLGI